MGDTQQDRRSQMRYALVTVPPLYGFYTYRMARVQGKCCPDAGEDCNVAMRGSGSPHRRCEAQCIWGSRKSAHPAGVVP